MHFSARNNSCIRLLATVCILPDGKSGVHMPSRGGDTGNKQAPDQMSSLCSKENHNTSLILNLHSKFTRKVQKKRGGTERGTTSRERPGLSPWCLFILLFLQDLWDLCEVRGVMEECVSLEHEKKNYNIWLKQGRRGHGSFGRRPVVQINTSQK